MKDQAHLHTHKYIALSLRENISLKKTALLGERLVLIA